MSVGRNIHIWAIQFLKLINDEFKDLRAYANSVRLFRMKWNSDFGHILTSIQFPIYRVLHYQRCNRLKITCSIGEHRKR